MKDFLYKIFKKRKNIIIGVIHFPPLLGYRNFPGFKIAANNALKDLEAFEGGGVDGVIIENNYDIPHKIKVEPQIITAMTFLGQEIKKATKLPIGVSVLWNDYKAAFSIAKSIGGKFIRIPVFVDKVETQYGVVEGNPVEVLKSRNNLKLKNIAIFTDVHVKHAKLLNEKTIEQSAREAIKNKSDTLIVTGKWTGQAPELEKIIAVRRVTKDFPILVGSGVDSRNIKRLFKYADGAIVSTSLKKGGVKGGETNIKSWKQRIDIKKVKKLTSIIKKLK